MNQVLKVELIKCWVKKRGSTLWQGRMTTKILAKLNEAYYDTSHTREVTEEDLQYRAPWSTLTLEDPRHSTSEEYKSSIKNLQPQELKVELIK